MPSATVFSRLLLCASAVGLLLGRQRNCFHQEAIEKAEREFEIYREREMRMLESDFDKAVKRLKKQNDEDDKDES